jgi:hypothetical protein
VPNPQSGTRRFPPLSGTAFKHQFNTDAKIIAVIHSGSVIGRAPIVPMPTDVATLAALVSRPGNRQHADRPFHDPHEVATLVALLASPRGNVTGSNYASTADSSKQCDELAHRSINTGLSAVSMAGRFGQIPACSCASLRGIRLSASAFVILSCARSGAATGR